MNITEAAEHFQKQRGAVLITSSDGRIVIHAHIDHDAYADLDETNQELIWEKVRGYAEGPKPTVTSAAHREGEGLP